MSAFMRFVIEFRARAIGALVLAAVLFSWMPMPQGSVPQGPPPLHELEGTLAVQAIALTSTQSFRKWQDVLQRTTRTADDNRWRRQIAAFRALPVRARPAVVNRIFNRIPYRDDAANWGRKDYWASGPEMLARGAGDCEDYAIAKYMALQALGYGDDRLFLLTVLDLRLDAAHTVLMVREGTDWVVLDNRWPWPMPLAHYADTKPLYVLNRSQALWLARLQ